MYSSKEIFVGKIPLGAKNPVRIQSMTNTKTTDTVSTVSQIIDLVDAGCDYVRVSVPSVKDAENLKNIRESLKKNNCFVPLIADIHFNPEIAKTAAQYAEKIRINPGNLIKKNQTDETVYTRTEYDDELNRIYDALKPIVNICIRHNTAIRIGVNHGSLGPRILHRYGNTTEGMVVSAIEYIKILEDLNYRQLVISMKSSNIRTMIESNRELVKRMEMLGMNYPLHLGVTEAGEGKDGRIKSAVGIGILLSQGIGDTVRVSLTEDPVNEIPVALQIVKSFQNNQENSNEFADLSALKEKRKKQSPVFIIGNGTEGLIDNQLLAQAGLKDNIRNNRSADYIYTGKNSSGFIPEGEVRIIIDYQSWQSEKNTCPLFTAEEYLKFGENKRLSEGFLTIRNREEFDAIKKMLTNRSINLIIGKEDLNYILAECNLLKKENPIIIKKEYSADKGKEFQIKATCDLSPALYDNLCDGIWISDSGNRQTELIRETVLHIFQATGRKISQNEYISCPTCARTSFNIQKIVAEIKKKTGHLSGLKIAVMGCIVNGPGEMTDADFGYVGSGNSMVTLYKGKNIIFKNIPETEAVEKLMELINNRDQQNQKN